MIKKDGTNIASTDKDQVSNTYNVIEQAKDDTNLQALADIEKNMCEGETGIGDYTLDGVGKYIAYAPVNGTEWSVGVMVAKSEMLSLKE